MKFGAQVDLKQLEEAYFQSRVITGRQYESILRLLTIFAQHLSALSIDRIVPVLESALQDPHPYVRGQAESAASDFDQYLGVVIRGYQPDCGSEVP